MEEEGEQQEVDDGYVREGRRAEEKGEQAIDDGHVGEGTVWTATAHVVTAVIGSGVLALAWSMAQLGWIVGPLVLLGFAFVTYYTATLLIDCYRYPHPVTGKRNHTYTQAVRAYLGPRKVFMCGIAQYTNLWGSMVGYTLTAATSMMAVKRSDCFHENGHSAECSVSGNIFMIAFGVLEIILSQLPSLEKITWISVVAAIMSCAYALIALCLCIAKFASHGEFRGSLTGVKIGINSLSSTAKAWRVLQALGNISFAYTYADVLLEIQDTLRSPPPENQTMKRAAVYGIALTTIFYMSLGCIGYAAFGDDAPGNILTGFGFYEPFWLIDIGNICIVIHIIGAYQVFAQPIFALLEKWADSTWPSSGFFQTVHIVRLPCTESGTLNFAIPKLLLRTIFVIFTTIVAMLLPFFNAILGLLGAIGFWPLTIYFPVSMYIAQTSMKQGSKKWVILQGLSLVCLVVTIISSIGSIADIIENLKHAKLFKTKY